MSRGFDEGGDRFGLVAGELEVGEEVEGGLRHRRVRSVGDGCSLRHSAGKVDDRGKLLSLLGVCQGVLDKLDGLGPQQYVAALIADLRRHVVDDDNLAIPPVGPRNQAFFVFAVADLTLHVPVPLSVGVVQ